MNRYFTVQYRVIYDRKKFQQPAYTIMGFSFSYTICIAIEIQVQESLISYNLLLFPCRNLKRIFRNKLCAGDMT